MNEPTPNAIEPRMTPEAAEAWIAEQAAAARQVQAAVAALGPRLAEAALAVARAIRAGGTVFFFGNGGSAADAQHWAAELSGRFYLDRTSLPAVALTTNASSLTAIANDYGYEEVFARPLAGIARGGDVAVGISTSGRSPNVVRALEVAREAGLLTLGFTGPEAAAMGRLCDYLFPIPGTDVARIQEGHALCGHLLCAVVERALFGDGEAAP